MQVSSLEEAALPSSRAEQAITPHIETIRYLVYRSKQRLQYRFDDETLDVAYTGPSKQCYTFSTTTSREHGPETVQTRIQTRAHDS
jgi:hypothetical protein